MKEPLRNTLLPPYGHTKRMGISTVPATPPAASLAESMLWPNIQPRIKCYFENTLQAPHFIAAPAPTLQIQVNAAPIQCTTKPKKRKKKIYPKSKKPLAKKKKLGFWCLIRRENQKEKVPISHCNRTYEETEAGTEMEKKQLIKCARNKPLTRTHKTLTLNWKNLPNSTWKSRELGKIWENQSRERV